MYMQRLIAKVSWDGRGGEDAAGGRAGGNPAPWGLTGSPSPQYNQPFEDDPLVQMATLTYETPQGTEPSSSWQCSRKVGSRICSAAPVPPSLTGDLATVNC